MQLAETLARLEPGTPRLLVCAEPRLTLLRARRGPVTEAADAQRLAVLVWSQLPGLREQIAMVLARFSELAQALYPHWRVAGAVNPHWRKRACALCETGQLPRISCAPAEQLRQLALTLSEEVTVLLVVDQVVQRDSFLAALTRTAEWVARTTGGRVAILAPAGLAGHGELQRLAYAAIDLEHRSSEVPVAGSETRAAQSAEAGVFRGCTAELWPVGEGQPHPGSPGEQLLALALDAAADLCGRFAFNQRVSTATGTQYCVDLLWRGGSLVVEVDGYRHHSDREAFAVDRQRDYALLVSGYRVLRLTYDEVRLDLPSALQKIRAVVAFVERGRP